MNEAVRKALRDAIQRSGRSQQAIADGLGVTQGMVSQYLLGTSGKVPEALQALLDELGLELIAVTPEQRQMIESHEPVRADTKEQ